MSTVGAAAGLELELHLLTSACSEEERRATVRAFDATHAICQIDGIDSLSLKAGEAMHDCVSYI